MVGPLGVDAIRRRTGSSKRRKKDATSSKGNNVQCKACGAFMHTAKKCYTPKHLVALYQKSLGKDKKVQGSGPGYSVLHPDRLDI
jgi:hypothetical protein